MTVAAAVGDGDSPLTAEKVFVEVREEVRDEDRRLSSSHAPLTTNSITLREAIGANGQPSSMLVMVCWRGGCACSHRERERRLDIDIEMRERYFGELNLVPSVFYAPTSPSIYPSLRSTYKEREIRNSCLPRVFNE